MLILLTFNLSTSLAQEFESKERYLIDSLDMSEMADYDRHILDSAISLYHAAKHDTGRVGALAIICEGLQSEYWTKYLILEYNFVENKIKQNQFENDELKRFYLEKYASSIANLGYVEDEKGLNRVAITHYQRAVEIYQELADSAGLAGAYNNLGASYTNIGEIQVGLDFHFKGLKIYEYLEHQEGISACLSNIAYLYDELGDKPQAKLFYEKSYDIASSIEDYVGMGYTLNNLGYLYEVEGEFEVALSYFRRSLKIRKSIGEMEGVATSIHSIASIYLDNENLDSAIIYFNKALKIREESEDLDGVTYSLCGLAKTYNAMGMYEKSESLALKALTISKQIEYPENISFSARLLSLIYENLNQYDKALEMFKLYKSENEKLHNSETDKLLGKKLAEYEFDKQKEIDEKEHEKKLAIEHQITENRNTVIYFSIALLLIVIFFLINYFYRFKETKAQKLMIEHVNNEITSSINYAKRIQSAVLPEIKLENLFPNSFLIYHPKDVVSGDFYWWERIDNKILFAVADCTGHGVPGGFMSMLGSIFLNEIFNSKKIYQPSLILDELSKLMRITLVNEQGMLIKDGMDVSFACLNTDTLELEWSGAFNPLYILRNEEFKIIKGDRRSIGYTENETSFTHHKVQLEKGDKLYLFTDGFADQFGGPNDKKLGNAAFREMLLKSSQDDMKLQGVSLEKAFAKWKGDVEEQIDDICMLGIGIQ